MHARHAASAAADASGGVGVGGSPPSSDVPLSSTRRRRHDLSYSAAFVRPPPPCTPPGYLAAVYPNRCTSPLYGQTRRSIRSATLPPAKSLLASPPSRRRPRARFRVLLAHVDMSAIRSVMTWWGRHHNWRSTSTHSRSSSGAGRWAYKCTTIVINNDMNRPANDWTNSYKHMTLGGDVYKSSFASNDSRTPQYCTSAHNQHGAAYFARWPTIFVFMHTYRNVRAACWTG